MHVFLNPVTYHILLTSTDLGALTPVVPYSYTDFVSFPCPQCQKGPKEFLWGNKVKITEIKLDFYSLMV